MSEQEKPKSYMQELNQWIAAEVVDPLVYGDADGDPNSRQHDKIVDDVYQAIRQKVLESYHNGQAAGVKAPKPARSADSEGCRSAFRTDVDHDSEVMPISIPNRSRSVLRL